MSAQIGYFDTLKSVAGKVFTFLSTITLTGTDGKTITVTQDTSLDEAVAMSSKAPKADVIKGDGTAGRVLRITQITIQNATDAAHIKCHVTSHWNGDTQWPPTDNIGKDAIPTENWALDANGYILSWLASGITGDAVAVPSVYTASNASGVDVSITPVINAGGIDLIFVNSTTGATVDLTTLVDTGLLQVWLTYITSA